jgi:hypothetical protein
MSHISRIKTQMVEKTFLTQALTDLGYTWEEGEVTITGLARERAKAEIKVKTGFFSAEIGFVKRDETYEMVADWSGVRNIKREQFQNQLLQRYAYHAARARLQAQGFDLVSEETSQDGQVHLVLRRLRA